MTDYVDSDAAANAVYWEGAARLARIQESNERRFWAHKGMRVEVTGGRKYKGQQGVVFWTGESRYDGSWRVGIETDDGSTIWAAYSQIEVLGDYRWDGDYFVSDSLNPLGAAA